MSTRVTDVAISKQLDAGEVPDELVAAYQETQQHAELPGAVADRVPSSMELATMYATGKASYNFPFIPAPPGTPQDAVVVNVEAKASSSPAPLLSPPLERQDSLLDFLDSQDSTLDDIMTWDEAKRQRFIEGLSPEWVPKLIAKARKAGWLESPVDVTFRNLFYQKNGVTLVNGVSGYVKRGTMVAVIGEGATDLFEVITGHARGGIISGEMLVNGKPPDEAYKRLIGFVSKDDVHLPTLTVRETLRFSSMLRSKPELPDVGKLFRCELVMKTLGLQHCAESIVGDGILRGISGGEKRRLSVAVELVAGHSLIVADLPTNGLDSASAMRLVTNVRNATKAGASQIMSLAQPSPELLNMFDSVILLSRGTVIFQGPPNEAESYFAGLGFYRPKDKAVPDFLEELCKQPQKFYLAAPDEVILSPAVQRKQPVEIAIEEAKEVGAALPERSVMSGTTLKDSWHLLVQSYKKSKMYADLGHVLWTELEPVFDYRSTKAARPKEFQTSLLVQTIMCLVRQWRITIRNKAVSTGGILRAIVMGLLVGTVFYKMGESQSDARARIGMLFYVLAFAGMSPMQTVPAFIEQRTVYYAQQKSGYFRGLAYFISYTLTSVPFVLIELFIYSLFVYGMAGLAGGVGSEQFWYFWLTLVMMSLVSRAFCLFTASLSPNGIVASALPPVALVLFIIFCGFLMPKESIPSGWIWLYYISFFTYGIKGLAINEYFSLTFGCASSDRVPLTSNPLYSIAPPVGFGFTLPDQGTCPVSTGHDMLARYGMDTSDEFEKWNLWFRLIIFYVCFNAAAAVVLVFIDWSGETTVEPLPVGDPDTLDPNTPYIPRQNSELRKAERKETASSVEFNNLQYSVDVPSKEKRAPPFCMKRKMVEKTLLNNVFGYAEPGKMIALMGASGAGKSTLLDVLANKKTGGHIKGKLLFNGKPRDEYFSRWAGYVEQFDSHFETATVREAIEFSASLRLPSDISKADKDRRVRRVMEQLELTNVANERIGNVESGGLSPELRKKVTIAVELVMDPGMLFLDEPTTGLGSAAAVEVMNVVRKLADEISVMCTIHQPSEEIVKLFDWLLLLQPGGTVVYFGPVSEVAAYFKSQGLGEIQPGQNVADFALQVIGNRSLDRKRDPSIPDPAALFLESEQGKQVKAKLEQPTIVPQGQTFRSFSSPQASGFFVQFLVTLKRFFEMQARQPSTLMVRGGTSTIMALVIGTLFYQLPLDQAGANNRVSMIYLALMLTNFTASSAIHSIIDQRPVYFRENTSNMYSFFAFWLSRLLSDMPFIIVQNFVFCVITYWMAGFTDAESGAHFGRYYAMMLIGAFMAYAFSELCAIVAPDAELANVLNTLVLTIMMLFAGFLVQKSSIPDPWIFMYYINFFRYPLFFLMSNEIADLTFSCPGNTGAVYAAVNQTYCVSHSLTDPLCYKIQCPITQGKQTLEQFSVDYSELSLYFGATVVIWVGLRLLGLLGFRFINHIKR